MVSWTSQRLFMHPSSLLHLMHTVAVHVTLCCADLHVPFGSDLHIINPIEMRCCLTAWRATLTRGCTHLKLNHVGCIQQYIDDVASCNVSSLLSFAQGCSWALCSRNFGFGETCRFHTRRLLQLRSGKPSSFHAANRPRDSVCLVLEASPCLCLQDASIYPKDPCKTNFLYVT